MVQAAEHHTAASQGLQGGQSESLRDAATTPVIRRVIQHNLGAVEQIHQVLNPSGLHLNPEALGLQGRNQLLQDIVAGLALLHQDVNAALSITAPLSPLQPLGTQGIGNQAKRITRSTVTPVTEGVAAHRQHRNSRRQGKAIAAAVGVIRTGAAAQLPQQPGDIKAPAHNPKSTPRATWEGLGTEQVSKEWPAFLALAVGHQLNRAQPR